MKINCIFVLIFTTTHLTYAEESAFKKKIKKITLFFKNNAKKIKKPRVKTQKAQPPITIPRNKAFVRGFIKPDCFLCKQSLPLQWPQKISLCRDDESGVSHEFCSRCLAEYTLRHVTKSNSCNAECPECLTTIPMGTVWKIFETANIACGSDRMTQPFLDNVAVLINKLNQEREKYRANVGALTKENEELKRLVKSKNDATILKAIMPVKIRLMDRLV